MLLKTDKCPIFLDIYGQKNKCQKKYKKNSMPNYFTFFSAGDHKNFYAVDGSPKITSTLLTNKVPRILKLDIYKCPFLKS